MFSFAEIHRHKAMELGPPSILVNASGEIVHIAEHAIRYLRHASGEPTRDIVSLVEPELRLELRMALFQAQKTGKPAATPAIRHQKDGRDGGDGKAGMVGMTVVPFEDEHADGLLLLVQFNEAGDAPPLPPAAPGQRDASLLRQLEEELRHTQDKLHESMDQADMSNAELRASNEELQSTVEELRSAVEEQDASREELQSVNEELMTLNAQLKIKVDETAKSHDDLSNLIASTGIATIFLDREMRIKRYTPRVKDIFNIIAADVGRPLSHLASRLDFPQLVEEAARVFDTLQPTEREARSSDGRFYIIRVSPYRTIEDRIDGAVMTFFDITIRRDAEQALRRSEERHRAELEQQVKERTAELKASRDLLQATMDTSMDMIQVFEAVRDERGEIVDFRWVLNNHTSESRYGEVRGQSLLERNPGVVGDGIFDAFKHVTETGEPQQAERHYTHEQFNGWFLQSVVKLGDGVATTTKEITDWKQSQEEVLHLRDEITQAKLRESEGRFRALVEGSAQAVWETDAQGMVVTDSPSWRAYTGQSVEEWMGEGWVNAVHPEDRDGALCQWQDAVAGGHLVNAEFRLKSPHGWRWTNVRAVPVFNDDGSLRKWVGLNIDISARKDMEFTRR
jgi:PAS domain S-box-containing protein